MKIFTITEDQVKNLWQILIKDEKGLHFARVKGKLMEMFPSVFEPEWEEVSIENFYIAEMHQFSDLRHRMRARDGEWVFDIVEGPARKDYKIEDGKIWRRKA